MKLLEDAAANAVKVVAYNQAYYAQLRLIDRKTNLICERFVFDSRIEPTERLLLAEDLLRLQQARNRVVESVTQLNLMEGFEQW